MAKAPRPLAGKVAAITGGARGIGRATAAALIARGVRVAIGDLDAGISRLEAGRGGYRCRPGLVPSPRSGTRAPPLPPLLPRGAAGLNE